VAYKFSRQRKGIKSREGNRRRRLELILGGHKKKIFKQDYVRRGISETLDNIESTSWLE